MIHSTQRALIILKQAQQFMMMILRSPWKLPSRKKARRREVRGLSHRPQVSIMVAMEINAKMLHLVLHASLIATRSTASVEVTDLPGIIFLRFN